MEINTAPVNRVMAKMTCYKVQSMRISAVPKISRDVVNTVRKLKQGEGSGHQVLVAKIKQFYKCRIAQELQTVQHLRTYVCT